MSWGKKKISGMFRRSAGDSEDLSKKQDEKAEKEKTEEQIRANIAAGKKMYGLYDPSLTPPKVSFKDAWKVVSPYFTKSNEKWKARALLGSAVGLTLGLVGGEVLMNYWWNDFVTGIQNVISGSPDQGATQQLYWMMGQFAVLSGTMVGMVAAKKYIESALHAQWRSWMSEHYVEKWLDGRAHYRLHIDKDNPVNNPDQRISENVQRLTGESIRLSMEFLRAAVTFPAFAIVLWNLSGTLEFNAMGHDVSIPGFLMWGAVAYAALGTWAAHKVGKPLAKMHFHQQQYEGDFRNTLSHVRSNAESIALYRGEKPEKKSLKIRIDRITGNLLDINGKETQLLTLRDTYNRGGAILPYALMLPKALTTGAKWGEFAASAHAFNELKGALSWLFYSYTSIARLQAMIASLVGLDEELDKAKETEMKRYPDRGTEGAKETPKQPPPEPPAAKQAVPAPT